MKHFRVDLNEIVCDNRQSIKGVEEGELEVFHRLPEQRQLMFHRNFIEEKSCDCHDRKNSVTVQMQEFK